jgi:ferrous iron transport protein B
MNAEIKDRKWFWGGIALQLATGYTVAYLVYTIGTLLTAPVSLSIPAAIGGGCFVALFGTVLVVLCVRGSKNKKAERFVLERA